MSYQINVAKILREKNSNTIDMVLCDKNDLEKKVFNVFVMWLKNEGEESIE